MTAPAVRKRRTRLDTHCINDHEFTAESTGYTKNGWRFCKICKRVSDRRTRAKPGNAEKNVERGKAWRLANVQRSRDLASMTYSRMREVIEQAKDAPCMDCGQRYPHYVMDFDHRDPTEKLFSVGRGRGLKALLAEIAKCDLVCANCHRVRTWQHKQRKVVEGYEDRRLVRGGAA